MPGFHAKISPLSWLWDTDSQTWVNQSIELRRCCSHWHIPPSINTPKCVNTGLDSGACRERSEVLKQYLLIYLEFDFQTFSCSICPAFKTLLKTHLLGEALRQRVVCFYALTSPYLFDFAQSLAVKHFALWLMSAKRFYTVNKYQTVVKWPQEREMCA